MAQTDSPLKDLVETSIVDFAAWLLDAEVRDAQAVNIEFPGQDARVDRLFQVWLADGRQATLHIEFQGRSTSHPVRFRMLDYMTRIVRSERELNLHSVVFYVGEGVGALDTGNHQIADANGQIVLHWRYQVVHLWKINATDLLALNRPALLALVGQTKIDEPRTIIAKVVEQLRLIPDEELRRHLLFDMMALIDDQEIIKMIEEMIKEDGLLMNTPFLRRVRAEERVETHRQDILNALVWRFDPPSSVYQQIEQRLKKVNDEETLTLLHKTAVQVANFQDFQVTLQTIEPRITKDDNIA
ncbi:MAG: hypothetical protein R3C14_25865 [Caldilineaceae bacterium]